MSIAASVSRASRELVREPSSAFIGALLVARVAVVAITLGNLSGWTVDMVRFQELAATRGVPYRDYPVEFAPLELLAARLIGIGTIHQVAVKAVLLSFAIDLAVFAVLSWTWGRRVGAAYLLIGIALFPFRYLLAYSPSVLLATGAFASIRRGRQRAGGVSLALSVLYKLWPLVLVPGLFDRTRRRALSWFSVTTALALAGWVGIGGVTGINDVMTFRHAGGWEIEGTPGIISWLSGSTLSFEQGSVRAGHVTTWVRVALAVMLVAALALAWWRGRDKDPAGVPALSAVAILLALSPLFSPQYVVWLLPWAAITVGTDEDAPSGVLVGVICLLTSVSAVILFYRTSSGVPPFELAIAQGSIAARNLFCAWVWIRGVTRVRPGSRTDPLTANETAP
jgi:hypothetical protein